MKALFYALGIGAVGWFFWKWLHVAPNTGASSAPAGPTTVPTPVQPVGSVGYLEDPMQLVAGQRYRMRISTTLTSAAAVAALGFSNMTVYTSPSALPADWPSTDGLNTQNDPATIFAAATWSRPSGSVAKITGLFQVWPTRSTL